MPFHKKLDDLMNLLEVRNSKLAREANIDPSVVSRWRRGLKAPLRHSDSASAVVRALAMRLTPDHMDKFAAMAGIDRSVLNSPRNMELALEQWLFSNPQSQETAQKTSKLILSSSYKERPASILDSLSTDSAHFTGEKGRKKALRWAISFVRHWSLGGTLRYYTDQPLEWAKLENNVYDEAEETDSGLCQKFSMVKIMIPAHLSAQDLGEVLGCARRFMDFATISIACDIQNASDTFQHSLGIYNTHVAVLSFGFRGSRYIDTQIYSDETFLHQLAVDFDAHFNSAESVLHKLRRFDFGDILSNYSELFSEAHDLYYCSHQVFLPLVPPPILKALLQDTDLPAKEIIPACVRLRDQMQSFLKNSKLYLVLPNYPLSCFEEEENRQPCLSVSKNCRLFLSRGQYAGVLKNLQVLYQACENLELSFSQDELEYPYLCVQKNGTMTCAFLAQQLASPYQSGNKQFIHFFYRKLAQFFPESCRSVHRTASAQRLEEMIKELS